jgi:glucose/arabinose dehydrogenase/PKD repeat protein
MLRRIFSIRLMVVLIAAAAFVVPSAATASVPSGMTDSLVASVAAPSALAFTPDGRLLVTSQTGALQVVQGGTLLPTPALNLGPTICSNSERGLLGIATDPAFATNHFIYLYYTAAIATGCVNRVSRFVLSDANIVDPTSEMRLLDNIPSPAGNHNGGDVQFGHDGYLYVSVGDGGCDYDGDSGCAAANAAARDLNVLLGKVLRITSDGGIPPDNPFLGTDSARCNLTGRTDPGKTCQETFAWGLRNPFRIAFDPNSPDTRFYINDVGQNTWEEIDAAQAGADYGWNVREGFCATGSTTDCGPPPAGMTNPIFAYAHANGCNAITAGAFVPNGVWPAAYDGAYLFADYLCGTIFQLVPSSGGGFTATDFATGLGVGGPITMMFGPVGQTQALYYTTYANGGQVRRIEFIQQQNQAPTAAVSANVTSGPAPLTVTFDASASSDPDQGDTLTYVWDFGDGTSPTETTSATVTRVYSTPGTFTATLTVRDNHGATSAPAMIQIQVAAAPNRAPTAVVSADVTSGPAPLTVTFDASGSSDPDLGDTLAYVWDFGDGTNSTETTTATVTRVYTTPGTFTATLTVRDNHGAASAPATIQIQVGNPLVAPQNLVVPTVSGMLRVGNILTAGTGTWMGSETLEYSYQWMRCDARGNSCLPILAATEATYTLAPLDFGSTIRVVVTARNAAGSAVATSNPTERVKHECSGSPCTSQLS